MGVKEDDPNYGIEPLRAASQTHLPSFWLGVFVAAIIAVILAFAWVYINHVRESKAPIISNTIHWDDLLVGVNKSQWMFKPNIKAEKVRGLGGKEAADREWSFSTNEAGLRNVPVIEKGKRLRILALGDSTAFGLGVQDDETWPFYLQNILDASRQNIDVINAGVLGTTLFQGLAYLRQDGLAFAPDVVVASFGYNDHMPSPFRDTERAGNLNPDDRGMPNVSEKIRMLPEEYIACMREIACLCAERNIKLFFVLWPERSDILLGVKNSSYAPLTNFMARFMKTDLINLWPAFLHAPQAVYLDDVHATPTGNRIAAESVAHVLIFKLNMSSSASFTPDGVVRESVDCFTDLHGKQDNMFSPAGLIKTPEILARQGKSQEAFQLFDYIFQCIPLSAVECASYYDFLKEFSGTEDRIEHVRKLTIQHEKVAPVWFIYGRSLSDSGDLHSALSAFQKAAELDPGDPGNHLAVAGAYESLHDYISAVEAYKVAAAIAPQDAQIKERLANALRDSEVGKDIPASP